MPVRGGEAVGGPVAEVPVNPALAKARGLQGLHPAFQGLGGAGAPGHVAQAGLGGLGDLQGVVVPVLVGPHVHGLPLLLRDLHAQEIAEEPEGPFGVGGVDLHVGQLVHVKNRLRLHGLPPRFGLEASCMLGT